MGLKEIQDVIAKIDLMPGAKEFLDELRTITQVIILSDTFEQFATPLMKKLDWPTIFCNTLEVAENGEITGFRMRCPQSKLTTVKALQSIGYDTIASGDSFKQVRQDFCSSQPTQSRTIIPIFLLMRNTANFLTQSKKHYKK